MLLDILLLFGRRNINNYQRSVLALRLEDVFKAKAKENLVLTGIKVSEFTNQGLSTLTNLERKKFLLKTYFSELE